MASHTNHGSVCGQLRQSGGVDSVDFKKIGGCLDPSPLVAVEEGLAFGYMESVGSDDFEDDAGVGEQRCFDDTGCLLMRMPQGFRTAASGAEVASR
jgi:hypothetical protein